MFERRLQILLSVMVVVCVVIGLRAVALQAVGHDHWNDLATKALSDNQQIPTVRGRILDVKGRELAIDEPCVDACVDYQAVTSTPTGLWLNGVARVRVKRLHDNYADLPLAQRKTLLAAEVVRVKADIETMWHDLAVLSHQSDDAMDDVRTQIVRRVETRRRLVWYGRYHQATTKPAETKWYSRLLGAAQATLDQFDLHVEEESQEHIVLSHIDYDLRNELGRRIDRYPGLDLREGVRRVYPYGSIACQTIGRIAKVTSEDLLKDPRHDEKLGKYAATDDIGRDGLEKMLEPQLRGTRGERSFSADGTPRPDTPPAPGQDVTTTLDVDLQAKIEEAFKRVEFTPSSLVPATTMSMPGAAVVIDVPTGEVRAMASWPTYDLNKFDELFPAMVKDQINRPLMNRATLMAVEPGSTVKPIIGMAGITDGVIGPLETIHCNGFLVLNGREMRDGRCWVMQMRKTTHAGLYPGLISDDLTFPQALQQSCNVFHETVAYRLGVGRVSFWFDKFGIGRATDIGLPESWGLKPDGWVGPASQATHNTYTAGIGEGNVAATPLQMANVAATIARSGQWVAPTLRSGTTPEPVDLHVNPVAMAEARQGMEMVVNTPIGTGRAAHLDGVVVAAKTGSAQTGPWRIPRRDKENKPIKDDRGRVIYDTVEPGRHDGPNPDAPWYRFIGEKEEKLPVYSWMIGYAPADHPKVAFAVLVEFGNGGGAAGGSVLKALLKACQQTGYLPE